MNEGLRKALIVLAFGTTLAGLATAIALREAGHVRTDLGGMAVPKLALPVVRPEGGATQARLSPSDFKGRPLLLHFWAPSCRPCVAELPLWQKRFEVAAMQGYAVLAVAGDDAEDVQKFLKEGGYTLPVVVDASGQLFSALRVTAIPATAAVDRRGVVVEYREGVVSDAEFPGLLARARR
jgi:peroxiredoxin